MLRLDPEPWSQNLKEALSLESSKSDEIVKQKHKASHSSKLKFGNPLENSNMSCICSVSLAHRHQH